MDSRRGQQLPCLLAASHSVLPSGQPLCLAFRPATLPCLQASHSVLPSGQPVCLAFRPATLSCIQASHSVLPSGQPVCLAFRPATLSCLQANLPTAASYRFPPFMRTVAEAMGVAWYRRYVSSVSTLQFAIQLNNTSTTNPASGHSVFGRSMNKRCPSLPRCKLPVTFASPTCLLAGLAVRPVQET